MRTPSLFVKELSVMVVPLHCWQTYAPLPKAAPG